jgi:hypothetical protein
MFMPNSFDRGMPRVQVYRPDDLRRARAGSAVDALIVAIAEPGGTVLTGDRADIEALAAHADRVAVELV